MYSEKRVHLGNNPTRLVASTYYDHGMGPPYYPHWILHTLYEATHREHGKKFFLSMDPSTSMTWISDEKAVEIKAKYDSAEYQPREGD